MRIYLAGPMTGLPEFNHPEFNRVAGNLREMGHMVFNPAECNPPVSGRDAYRRAMAVDLAWISSYAESVWVLPGWETSKGCAVEIALANALDIPVGYVATDAPGLAKDWASDVSDGWDVTMTPEELAKRIAALP